MLQNKHQIPVNVPTPPVGHSTLFADATDGGKWKVKLSNGDVVPVSNGGSLYHEKTLEESDIKLWLRRGIEVLPPLPTNHYYVIDKIAFEGYSGTSYLNSYYNGEDMLQYATLYTGLCEIKEDPNVMGYLGAEFALKVRALILGLSTSLPDDVHEVTTSTNGLGGAFVFNITVLDGEIIEVEAIDYNNTSGYNVFDTVTLLSLQIGTSVNFDIVVQPYDIVMYPYGNVITFAGFASLIQSMDGIDTKKAGVLIPILWSSSTGYDDIKTFTPILSDYKEKGLYVWINGRADASSYDSGALPPMSGGEGCKLKLKIWYSIEEITV